MKKLFLIAPHFPPSALPPSQRIRLTLPHWRSCGFEVTVFTVEQRYREEEPDPWMRELVGTGFRLVELPALPYQITRRIGVGDLAIRAIPFLFPRLLFELVTKRPDFVIWLVPPWYLLTLAPSIGFLTGVPYGIDFIDPWVDAGSDPVTVKGKISQWLARFFEARATRGASILYAVSPGILDGMRKRYGVAGVPAFAIPYGVELEDFRNATPTRQSSGDQIVIRYIGAIWPDGMRPLTQIIRAVAELRRQFALRVEFYGTSYSGQKNIANQTDDLRASFEFGASLTEHPKRISYRKAVELTLGADVLFLFGGMLAYYAASKLMGLIASQRPFLAFVHRASSPYELLRKLEYPYVVGYSDQAGDGPEDAYPDLLAAFRMLIEQRGAYCPIDCGHPLVVERSAMGMTRQFADAILQFLEKNRSL